MTTITIQLKNVDKATAKNVADFVLWTLEKEGLKNNISQAEVTSDEPQKEEATNEEPKELQS